ncbi:MAG: hypothetical protein ACREPM_20400 [Gemmatimonadaceae bacterium]
MSAMRARRLVPLGLAALASCHVPPGPMVVPPPPALPDEQIAPPPARPPVMTSSPDTSVMVTVSVDTHGRETDVRDLLTFLGQTAGVHFVFSPQINKRIRVALHDVPVSTAIEIVLAEANLTLEGTTSLTTPPTPAVVFYQLPVNVDSLSADAIMKQFGVGRVVAEMLIQARPPKP